MRSEAVGTHQQLRERLIASGLMVPTSQEGITGFTPRFEGLVDELFSALDEAALRLHSGGPERFHFPPVVADPEYRASGYVSSFPQLAGLVATFEDSEKAFRSTLAAAGEQGPTGDDVFAHFGYSQIAMASVACHPLYAMLAESAVGTSRTFEVTGRCFRHEPSPDPMRLQAFRMREYVAVGSESDVLDHADAWASEIPAVMKSLGVTVHPELANDPFFGRGGRLLASAQRDTEQKTEFLAAVYAEAGPTAIASVNRPRSHFGELFSINGPDGDPAHTVCVGFGVERIVIAMIVARGLLDP